jgi:ribulose-5-phosphate 4-epimerase/fuculose-1-phosphate aldolase
VIAAAHTHSTYGKAWSSLGRLLDPISQDATAFYNDHVLFDDYTGVVLEGGEGERIATALGDRKAAILRNHGFLTVASTVEAAIWWYIAFDNAAHTQLLAEAAGEPIVLGHEVASLAAGQVGNAKAGLLSFQPLWDLIIAEQPDLLS